MFKKFFQATLAVVTLSSAIPASAAVILSSDFTGTSGDVTNVAWTENGLSVTNVLDPQNLGLNSLDLFGNFNDVFAVKYNIHTQGSWFVDVMVTTSSLVDDISLDALSLDASIYKNSGVLQSTQRDLSFSLEIFDGLSSIFSNTIDVFVGNNNDPGFVATKSIDFDLNSIVFDGGNDYVFRLTASGVGGGNNAGFDNFILSGSANTLPSVSVSVSATGSMVILFMSLVILSLRAKNKFK